MTRDELKNLKVGDRVRWIEPGQECSGTVVDKIGGFAHIRWDDGATKLIIGWRSSFDREKGKLLELMPTPPPVAEDASLLKYAGFLGHEFVGIVGEPGARRISTQANSIEQAKTGVTNTVYPHTKVYQHVGKIWLCVFDSDAPTTEPKKE